MSTQYAQQLFNMVTISRITNLFCSIRTLALVLAPITLKKGTHLFFMLELRPALYLYLNVYREYQPVSL
jgi:hypothetical protein